MAIYNEILVPRYATGIRKLFGMRGANPTRQLAGEITPVLPLFFGAEARFLEGWNRYGYESNPAAQVGVAAASRLRNPAGSNVIAVLERILMVNAGAADFPTLQHQATTADLAIIAFSPSARWDGRTGIQASALVRSESAAVPAPSLYIAAQGGILATVGVFDFILASFQELTLTPGDAVQVQSNNTNTSINVSFLWRERYLEESERQ